MESAAKLIHVAVGNIQFFKATGLRVSVLFLSVDQGPPLVL